MSISKAFVVVCASLMLGVCALVVSAQQPVRIVNVATDPCADPAKVQVHFINTVSTVAGAELRIAADGSDFIYVCSGKLQQSAAGSLRVLLGAGATCGTGTETVDRAIFTAGQDPPALVESGGVNATFVRSDAGDALCIDRSVTATVHGHIRYVQEP